MIFKSKSKSKSFLLSSSALVLGCTLSLTPVKAMEPDEPYPLEGGITVPVKVMEPAPIENSLTAPKPMATLTEEAPQDLPTRMAVLNNIESLFPQNWNASSRTRLTQSLSNQSPEKIVHIAKLLSRSTYPLGFGIGSYAQSTIFNVEMEKFAQQLGALSSEQLEAIATRADILFPKNWRTNSLTELVQSLSKQSPEKITPIAILLSMGTYLEGYNNVPYVKSFIFNPEMEKFTQQLSTLSSEQLAAVTTHADTLFPQDWGSYHRTRLTQSLSKQSPEKIPHIARLLSMGIYHGSSKQLPAGSKAFVPYAQSLVFAPEMEKFVQQLGALSSAQLAAIDAHADLLFPKRWTVFTREPFVRFLSTQSPERIPYIARFLSMKIYTIDYKKVPYAEMAGVILLNRDGSFGGYDVGKSVQELSALSDGELRRTTLTEEAIRGDFRAQYELGMMHKQGNGIPQNLVEAEKWFGMAARQNLAEAQYELGGLYLPTNLEAAVGWIQMAADQNYVYAIAYLAEMHIHHYGVEKNFEKALQLIRRVVDRYLRGEVDPITSTELTSLVQKQLITILEKCPDCAEKYPEEILELASKTHELSLLYLPNNPEESVKWSMRSADLMRTHAQRGQGVTKDPEEKETLPQKVVDQDDSPTQVELERISSNSVMQDSEEEETLSQTVAEPDDAEAKLRLMLHEKSHEQPSLEKQAEVEEVLIEYFTKHLSPHAKGSSIENKMHPRILRIKTEAQKFPHTKRNFPRELAALTKFQGPLQSLADNLDNFIPGLMFTDLSRFQPLKDTLDQIHNNPLLSQFVSRDEIDGKSYLTIGFNNCKVVKLMKNVIGLGDAEAKKLRRYTKQEMASLCSPKNARSAIIEFLNRDLPRLDKQF
ncbi:MAG: sel1 repeat family protein [Proteobacteria bacterium]|nr:sel1 repeat family protein [Pseudomonadota bacterium]